MKRLISSIPLVIGITFLSFVIMKLAPGDATAIFKNPHLPPEDLIQLQKNLGLDQPIVMQYLRWLSNVFQGNLGYSYVTGEPVIQAILNRLPATLLLSITSLLFILIITCCLGLYAGAHPFSKRDHFITIISFLGMSIPTFWLGLILILILSLQLNIFPTSGYLDPSAYFLPKWRQILNILHHMALPLLTIIIGGIAGLTQYHRTGIIQALQQDYIQAARARGLSNRRILFKHAFKNACLPIITILGLQLPHLISGSFVIEFIFAWPGMGQLGVNAIFARDYPIIMGTLLMSAILIIIGNLCADVAYEKIDPRISL